MKMWKTDENNNEYNSEQKEYEEKEQDWLE